MGTKLNLGKIFSLCSLRNILSGETIKSLYHINKFFSLNDLMLDSQCKDPMTRDEIKIRDTYTEYRTIKRIVGN